MTVAEILTLVKSKGFLNITDATYDTELTGFIEQIIIQAGNYIGETIVIDDEDLAFDRAIAKQVTYEWRNKRDLGVSSVTAPDGTKTKYELDEWLPAVLAVLDNRMAWAI